MKTTLKFLFIVLIVSAGFLFNHCQRIIGPLAQGPTKIVFVSSRDGNYEIYIMDGGGNEQTRLTNNSYRDMGPELSPDGHRIAFWSERNGNFDIYVMDVNGRGVRRLTDNPDYDMFPCWSPDGRKIAFASKRERYFCNVYVMNADGSNQVKLTDAASSSSSGLSWSPDGEKIAFTCGRDICVINIDGSNLINLTNHPDVDYGPAWSPDGEKIAFVSWRDFEGVEEVFVMNADGTDPVNISNNPGLDSINPGWDSGPSWSPDGQKLAFSSYRNGNYDIYIMNMDGSEQVNITNNLGSDVQSFWGREGFGSRNK